MLFTRKASALPTPEEALPGRDTPIVVPGRHLVLGTPIGPPFPEGTERAIFGMGCFWGAERMFWQAAGHLHDCGGLRGRLHAEPDLPGGLHRSDRAQRSRPRGVRHVEDDVRGDAPHLLGGPRPDTGHAPGQRRGHAVPLGDLLDERGATRSRARVAGHVPGGALDAPATATITTEIAEAGPFYYAEDYHQQYLEANPNGYCGLGGTGVSCPVSIAATS